MLCDMHYAEVGGLYDVTVTCRTGGIMIIMMFVVLTEAALVTTSGYCFFGCAVCVYFRLWLQYGDWYSVVIGIVVAGLTGAARRGLGGVVKVLR